MRNFGSIDFFIENLKLEGCDNRKYFVCIIEESTGIAWAEMIDNINGPLYVAALLECLRNLRDYYKIEFKELCTDNSVKFRNKDSSKEFHEMLARLKITHEFKSFLDAIMSKSESFFRVFQRDLLNKDFESLADFKEKLNYYLLSYNNKKIEAIKIP